MVRSQDSNDATVGMVLNRFASLDTGRKWGRSTLIVSVLLDGSLVKGVEDKPM